MLLIFLLPVSRKVFLWRVLPRCLSCFEKSEQRAFSLSRRERPLVSLLFFLEIRYLHQFNYYTDDNATRSPAPGLLQE